MADPRSSIPRCALAQVFCSLESSYVNMKVLVIGGGGREHALVWKISQSPKIEKLYCAPGSAAIGELAEMCRHRTGTDRKTRRLRRQAKKSTSPSSDPNCRLLSASSIYSRNAGYAIFGPNREAAQLEGSKAFAKEILRDNAIPTAAFGYLHGCGMWQRILSPSKRLPSSSKPTALRPAKAS